MAFNFKRSKFIVVALIAMLLFGNTLPKGAKAEELFQEESFSDIEETDPTPSPSAVSQTTPSAAPVSLQDEQLSEETPVPQASAGQTEKPTEATPAPTPSPSATQKPETTKTPEASATPLAKKDSFQSGYAEILKGTAVYSEEELYGNSLLGQFTESSSLVYVIERYGDGSSDKEVVLIAFAAMESDELTAQFAYTRVRNLKPIDPKKEKNVKRLISNGAYVYFDEEKEYPVGKCAFEFAASLEEPEILEEETLSEEEILSEEQGLLDQEISAEESVISEEAKDSSDPINSGTDATVEEGDTAPESDSVVYEALGEAQKQIDMSETQESAEKTDSLFEERQSEDTLADPISAESEERTEAAITEDTPDEEEVESWTSDAITEIIPSDNAALDDQPEAEKEETESSEVVIPSNEAVSDDQNPEENLANDEKGEAALSNQGNSTEESQAESDDSVQAVSSEKKAEEEELLEEEVLFGGEYAESTAEEILKEETYIEEVLTEDSEAIELIEDEKIESSEREPKPVSFTPRVALTGEGQARSFTLSADSYNPEGAELGEVTKVTVEGGEEAAFSDIEFTEAGTYGFAIMDDAQEEYPWELTVVVDENQELDQLYIDSTKTIYSRGSDTASSNNNHAEYTFIKKNEISVLEAADIEIKAKLVIAPYEINGKKYYPLDKINGLKFEIEKQRSDFPTPTEETIMLSEIGTDTYESEIVHFNTSLPSPGEYVYYVYEVDNSNEIEYLSFDSYKHEVRIIVVDEDKDMDGKYDYTILYDGIEEESLIITNQYLTNSLIVRLEVDSTNEEDHTIEFQVDMDTDLESGEFDLIIKKADGLIDNNKIFTNQKFSFSLKDTEQLEIMGLPVGTQYSIEAKDESGFIFAYDNNRSGIISKRDDEGNNGIITIISVLEETTAVSVDLDTWLLLYGYAYKDEKTEYYYYPSANTTYSIELIPLEGSPGYGNPNKTRINTGFFNNFSGAKFDDSYRSLRLVFKSIKFTIDDMGDETYKEFKYLVRQTKEEYKYIDYDILKQYQIEKEYEVIISVTKDEITGKLEAQVKELPTQRRVPVFENRFIATSIQIAKAVSGKGASSSDSFRIKLYLDDKGRTDSKDYRSTYRGWRFVASNGRITTSTQNGKSVNSLNFKSYSTHTLQGDGSLSFNLTHRDYIMIHGVPEGAYYEIEEDDYTSKNYYARYSVKVGSASRTRKGKINIEEDGNKNIIVMITNYFSTIPLTGYGNPLYKSYILFGCLSLAAICAYARRKLR